MRTLDESELRELADRYHIHVDGPEVDEILSMTNEKLGGLREVYEVPVPSKQADSGDRSWDEPTDDPHNALVTTCRVPPTTENSGVLSGMSVGVKDIVAVAGVPLTSGSATMQGYIPGFDAEVVDRLRRAGATITAKTNLDEFAGSGRGVSFFGQITNPYDTSRSAGGSSGGSAVAVATGLVDAALGTDTGGSIRLPASYCGVVGVKPTYGVVPLHGVVENTYTLDTVGPMTKTVTTAAQLLDTISGPSARDPASMEAAGRDEYAVGGSTTAVESPPSPEEVSLGLVVEGVGDGTATQSVESPIKDRFDVVTDALEDAGVAVEPVSIDRFEQAQPVKFAHSLVELAAHWRAGGAPLRRGGDVDHDYVVSFTSRREAMSAEVNAHLRARLLAGARLLDAHGGRHYVRALAAAKTITASMEAPLDEYDALILPTSPGRAPTREAVESPVTSFARNTIPANVSGQPALSLPAGTIEGVPTGVQLFGRRFEDAHLLGVAATVEPLVANGS
ncbi:hypothetical protein GJR96_15835 [Haloferax sp. MBLA0076]|uniref:Amidase domain-containing protein n=1 Tax=Haloferax litoreum TaxID=2666140 RepID=A0A6A8GJQ4_9EURY|nr:MULTISPECIES: amidase family protein [Haloferax]KAB1190448.1 hypothetical protein Hfx1148_15765 [Haloferax sp. CBA1148]MRX23423.1 hypothetical protein [Haloferax litoreum]